MITLVETKTYSAKDLVERFLNEGYINCANYLQCEINDDAVELFESELLEFNNFDDMEFDDVVAFIESRLKKSLIDVDSIVTIKNFGSLYTTYAEWFIENGLDKQLAGHYCYGYSPMPTERERMKNMKFIVLAKGLHNDGRDMIYAITPYDCTYNKDRYGKVFLINADGVKKA